MLRILLLSDIHFIHCEDDENDYRSLETALIEAMDEVRDSGGVRIYSPTVINNFGVNLVYSEKDNTGRKAKCLILDWANNACSYLY